MIPTSLCYLIAAGQVIDAYETGVAQHLLGNRNVGHPSRTSSGQLPEDIFNVFGADAQKLKKRPHFLQVAEGALTGGLGIITFAIRHECHAKRRAGAGDGTMNPNCPFTHASTCHCLLSLSAGSSLDSPT